MPPEIGRTRPGDNRTGSADLLAGGIDRSLSETGPYVAQVEELATAEQAVIGACILSEPQRRRVQVALSNDDIADGTCRMLDAAMRAMDAAGRPIDPITLAGYVEQNRLTDGLALRHIRSTIAAAINAAPISENAMHYGGIVIQAACRRTLFGAAAEIRRLAEVAPIDELHQSVGAQGRRAMAAINRAAGVAA